MRDAPPVVGRGGVLLAVQLLAREHVPEPELGLETALGLGDAAGDQRLRIDLSPVGKARDGVDVRDFFEIGGLIDRGKEARALQVRRDDLAHIAPGRRVLRRHPDEIRDRDRHRLDVALGHVELEHRRRPPRRKPGERARRRAGAQHEQPAAAQCVPTRYRSAFNHGSVVSARRRSRSSTDHVAWIERNLDVFPQLVMLRAGACRRAGRGRRREWRCRGRRRRAGSFRWSAPSADRQACRRA